MAEKWKSGSSPQPIEWLKGNVIGSGSFGTVHLAINTSTASLFVAKTAKSEAGIKSLKNEADILHSLDSPHIIKCIGKDQNRSREYSLFFEYMAGGSLSDMAQKFGGTLKENLIRLYTREILQGLKYLHKNRIVHSDIKCKNVLLGESGAIKLADFGCAKRVGTGNGMMIGGTPLWMAPEVLRDEGFDFAADIWSLGCTVIEMATGKPPWSTDDHNGSSNPMAIVMEIARKNIVPEFPKDFSEEGLDFLGKCLERDPRKRWSSERLLDHPFVRQEHNSNVCSPTSTMDFGIYDDDDEDDEIVHRIYTLSDKRKLGSDCFWDSSDNDWITVRSR